MDTDADREFRAYATNLEAEVRAHAMSLSSRIATLAVVGNAADKPPRRAVTAGKANRVSRYMRLAPAQYRRCLADGFPFVIGFTVYESFEGENVARYGRVPMPKKREAAIGGHAVTVIGYATKWGLPYYEVRNSWGDAWGDDGNCWMPARYLEDLNLADDAWTLRAA